MTNQIINPIIPGKVHAPVHRRMPIAKSYSQNVSGSSFAELLEQKVHGIKFSKHAQQRLAARGIKLSSSQLTRLSDAVRKLHAKGARESLVLLDNLALVVSVKNDTVITAMSGNTMNENVFTNIDSTIVVQ